MRLNKAIRQDLSTKINRQITSKFEERYAEEVATLVERINQEITDVAAAYYEKLGLSKDFFSNVKDVLKTSFTNYPAILVTDEKNPAVALPHNIEVNKQSFQLHKFPVLGQSYNLINLKWDTLRNHKDTEGNLPISVYDLLSAFQPVYNIPVVVASTQCIEWFKRLDALASINKQAREDLQIVLDSAVNLSQLPPDIAALIDIPSKPPAVAIPMPEALSAYVP